VLTAGHSDRGDQRANGKIVLRRETLGVFLKRSESPASGTALPCQLFASDQSTLTLPVHMRSGISV